MRAVPAEHLRRRADAGGIDDAVQPAERGHARDRPRPCTCSSLVTSACAKRRVRAERLLGGLARLGIDVEQDDVAAGARDGFRGRAAQARRAARHDECLSCECCSESERHSA